MQAAARNARARERRTHRNALTPLCRLPVETLRAILGFLVLSEHNHDASLRELWLRGDSHPYGDKATWTRVMLTCTHIRQIAIGSRDLWSYVDISCASTSRWTELTVQRAVHSPLAVAWSSARHPYHSRTPDEITRLSSLFTSLLPRAYEVHIYVPGELKNVVKTHLDQPMPFLRSLLYNHDRYFTPYLDNKACTYTLSSRFLGGCTEQLVDLRIRGMEVCLDGLVFPSLVRLDMVYIDIQDKAYCLRCFLASSRRLRTLRLRNIRCKPDPVPPGPGPMQRIRLPDLVTLEVCGAPTLLLALVGALPVLQAPRKYYIAVASPPKPMLPWEPGVSFAELHDEVFRLCGADPNPALTPQLDLFHLPSGLMHLLILRGRGSSGGTFSFGNNYNNSALEGTDHYLNRARVLRILGDGLCYLPPPTSLPNVEHLIIQNAKGGLRDLVRWLQARAATGPRPLKTLVIRHCPLWTMLYGSFEAMKEIIEPGLVDQVIEEDSEVTD
jgi:hypothetical protein